MPAGCTSISKATETSHTLTVGSVGSYARLAITATRGEELATTYSATLGIVESIYLELPSNPTFSYESLDIEQQVVAQGSKKVIGLPMQSQSRIAGTDAILNSLVFQLHWSLKGALRSPGATQTIRHIGSGIQIRATT